MLPYIKKYEPPKRRLRIRNKIRLTVSLILMLTLIVLTFLAIIIPHQNQKTSQVNYKPYQVGYGDTYWGIAKQLQEQGYRPRADIRDIVHELVKKSGIKAHELKEGDIILIPDMEGSE